MNDRRHITDRLAAYADDLLPPSERADIDRHLAECAGCRRAAAEEFGGRIVLRGRSAGLRSVPLPPGLRTRLEAATREGRQGVPIDSLPFWRRRLVPLSVTVGVILAAMLAVLSLTPRRTDTLFAAQLTAEHVKCVKDGAGPETTLADARRLEALLSEEYGWKVHVPPSSAEAGVELIGTRRCLDEGLIPHLVYRAGGRDMSLYMMEGQVRDEADVETLGYRSRVWSRGATTFVLVAPADAGDLTTAVNYLRQEAY